MEVRDSSYFTCNAASAVRRLGRNATRSTARNDRGQQPHPSSRSSFYIRSAGVYARMARVGIKVPGTTAPGNRV
jgi:hypothetical protein